MVTIQQGLKEDGIHVSMARLRRWFGVARRTVYYKPTKTSFAGCTDQGADRAGNPRSVAARRLAWDEQEHRAAHPSAEGRAGTQAVRGLQASSRGTPHPGWVCPGDRSVSHLGRPG